MRVELDPRTLITNATSPGDKIPATKWIPVGRDWDVNGMPTDEVPDVQGIDEYYDGYLDAHRLVRTDDVADAHGSTIDGETLAAAYMYLVCKAASG